MHILISCVGSAGDVHPFIAIGTALAQRGHDVELLTSPHFRTRIEAAGLGFTPVGTEADYQRVVQQAALWHPRRCFPVLWPPIAPPEASISLSAFLPMIQANGAQIAHRTMPRIPRIRMTVDCG